MTQTDGKEMICLFYARKAMESHLTGRPYHKRHVDVPSPCLSSWKETCPVGVRVRFHYY